MNKNGKVAENFAVLWLRIYCRESHESYSLTRGKALGNILETIIQKKKSSYSKKFIS